MSNLVIEAFIAALFGHSEGTASLEDITLAKATIAPLVDTSAAYRFVTFEMNLLGEPAMKVWTPVHEGVAETPRPAPVPVPLLTVESHFTSSARLRFDLPREGRVKLSVYNRGGRKVKNLAGSVMRAGHHEVIWDGCSDNGRKAPAGIYYVQLQTGDGRTTGKLVKLGKERP